MLLTEIVIHLVGAFLLVGIERHAQEPFILRTEHSEKVMGRDARDRHREIEIAAVLCGIGIVLRGLGGLGAYPAGTVDAAKGLADRCRLAQALGDDIARAGKRILDGRDFVADELARLGGGIRHSPDGEEPVGQGLQTRFAGYGGPGAPLRPVREIQILQLAGIDAFLYLPAKLRSKLPETFDGLEDGRLALLHLAEDLHPVLDGCDFHIVHAARPFLAVAADEGDGIPVFEHLGAVLDLPRLQSEQGGDMADI